MTVVDIAKSLISFDTSGPPAKERPLAKWIRDYLVDLGVDAELHEVAKDRANVVAKIGGGPGPVWFCRGTSTRCSRGIWIFGRCRGPSSRW